MAMWSWWLTSTPRARPRWWPRSHRKPVCHAGWGEKPWQACGDERVQSGIRLSRRTSGGSVLHLERNDLEGRGVQPHVEEPLSPEALWSGEDNQLKRAIYYLDQAAPLHDVTPRCSNRSDARSPDAARRGRRPQPALTKTRTRRGSNGAAIGANLPPGSHARSPLRKGSRAAIVYGPWQL